MWPTDESAPEKAPASQTSAAPSPSSAPQASAPAAPAREPDQAPPAAAAPSAPAAPRPIDRLHLATETAAAASDLRTLRKLKETWKNFMRSVAGPDRARAKREYADCLWAIQSITNRESDQREALLAYREYVLSSPAGGADARTVARMRFLEDAFTDK